MPSRARGTWTESSKGRPSPLPRTTLTPLAPSPCAQGEGDGRLLIGHRVICNSVRGARHLPAAGFDRLGYAVRRRGRAERARRNGGASMLDALLLGRKKTTMIDPEDALPGRPAPSFAIPARHEVLGTPLQGPFPPGLETAVFGLGCFWGAEQIFWNLPGVYRTAAAYAGGYTPNPTYEEVCSCKTVHNVEVQVVLVTADVNYTD